MHIATGISLTLGSLKETKLEKYVSIYIKHTHTPYMWVCNCFFISVCVYMYVVYMYVQICVWCLHLCLYVYVYVIYFILENNEFYIINQSSCRWPHLKSSQSLSTFVKYILKETETGLHLSSVCLLTSFYLFAQCNHFPNHTTVSSTSVPHSSWPGINQWALWPILP